MLFCPTHCNFIVGRDNDENKIAIMNVANYIKGSMEKMKPAVIFVNAVAVVARGA